ncbi:MAG TPA: HD domain-containing response regulator [Pseudobacteroides sp.]|uniref:HD domain-containing response regulator n=1 Tax=Pseudobacteroides sp. TaxID=1968840 RepID=UPI002F92E0D2
MRKRADVISNGYKVMLIDDEIGIVDSLSIVLTKAGYETVGFTDPHIAIETLAKDTYDILILDFLMNTIHGDEVVRQIREFNTDIYIIILTGHKDLAPPVETLKALDIQGYCEKNDRFDQLILLVESAVKSIAQRATIYRFKDGLNKILDAVPRIYNLKPIGNILEDILREIMAFTSSTDGFILIDDLINDNNDHKTLIRGFGRYLGGVEEFTSRLSPELMESIGQARMDKMVISLDNGIILPLLNEYHNIMGVIYIESNNYHERAKLLEIFASQASAALNNALLHSLINIKNEELLRTYDELKERYMDTIEVLRLAVDAKDVYTRGHSERVGYYARKIGECFNLDRADLEILNIAGVFHDIGKIGTTDDILLKTDKLDEKEYAEIKKHPLKGAHILSAVSMFKEVVPLVKYHHERIDGKGYPLGLKGEEIPFFARILSVADAFDAMTSDRLYRTKLGIQEARRQLIDGAGRQFDEEVVKAFVGIIDKSFDEMKNELEFSFLEILEQ